jgi:hypothetical protein
MDRTWMIADTASSFVAADFRIPGGQLGLDETAYCRKTTLNAGRQTGVEIIEISNGVLSMRVCPTRGMGIIDGRFGVHPLGWTSPVREIVHPQYIHLLEMGGRGCHYGFNEFLNRCGIEWSGAMGEDETIDNMGRRNRVFPPLHGRVGWSWKRGAPGSGSKTRSRTSARPRANTRCYTTPTSARPSWSAAQSTKPGPVPREDAEAIFAA